MINSDYDFRFAIFLFMKQKLNGDSFLYLREEICIDS